MTPPLSTKTGGGEGRRGNEEIRVRRGERWGGEMNVTRGEAESYCACVWEEKKREKEKWRKGRRSWDETSRRFILPPRCSDCSPKTIYGLYPWAIDQVQACLVVRGWRSGKRAEIRRGRKTREDTRVEFALEQAKKERKKETNLRRIVLTRRIFFLFNNGGKRLEEKFPW